MSGYRTPSHAIRPATDLPMKNIVHQESNLPTEVPVMILPQATLFPRTLMPLYIFEPRYRQMLRTSLNGVRMFCVAMMKPGLSEARGVDDFYHIAGLGLVRACVHDIDGTSRLVLQGTARVAMVDFVQDLPFRIARIRELRSEGLDSPRVATLAMAVIEKARTIQHQQPDAIVDLQLDSIAEDPEAVADLVPHLFVTDSLRRQRMLEEPSMEKRLAMLLEDLEGK